MLGLDRDLLHGPMVRDETLPIWVLVEGVLLPTDVSKLPDQKSRLDWALGG